MKVLIITPWFPNQRGGWPGGFVADSTLKLVEAGLTVGLLVARPYLPLGIQQLGREDHLGRIERDEFPEIEFFEEARYASIPGSRCLVLKNWMMDLSLKPSVSETVEEFGPDLIHIHTELFVPTVLSAVSNYEIPVIATIHGEHTDQRYIGSSRQKKRFAESLSVLDQLIVVGDPLRDYAKNLAQREDHISTIWNGVKIPVKPRKVPVPDSEPIRFVTVANLLPEKGIDLLFHSLANIMGSGLTDWSLHLVGSGPEGEKLKKLARALRIMDKIEFLGNISNVEVFELLSGMDIFVLPSYREAFGVAYLEAMSVGLATIGVANQGPSQFIEDGRTGYLVQGKDVVSLTNRLSILLVGPRGNWRTVARNGQEFVIGNMTWQAHASNLTDLYNNLVSEHGDF